MSFSTALRHVEAYPEGYSFNYDPKRQRWVAMYHTLAFRTTVEGRSFSATIEELYRNVSAKRNHAMIISI